MYSSKQNQATTIEKLQQKILQLFSIKSSSSLKLYRFVNFSVNLVKNVAKNY